MTSVFLFGAQCVTHLKSVIMETNTEDEPIITGSVDSSPELTDQIRTRSVPWNKLAAELYSVFLLWQIIGNCLYVVRVLECSIDKKLESFHCENITTFSSSKELELTWYITRLIYMILVVTAIQKVPNFCGYLSTLHKLKSLPAFWTLFVLLALGLIRYVILLVWSEAPLDFLLTFSFIMSCSLKLLVVGLFNYTQLNFIRRRYPAYIFILLKITLIIMALQSITDFCLGILQLALRADDLNHFEVGSSKNFRTVADLFRKSAECSFHFKTMNFFWHKIFEDNKSILKNNYAILEHTYTY